MKFDFEVRDLIWLVGSKESRWFVGEEGRQSDRSGKSVGVDWDVGDFGKGKLHFYNKINKILINII